MKAWAVTITSGGRVKHSSMRSFAASRRRRAASTIPVVSAPVGIGPNTPNCEPRKAARAPRLNSCTPFHAAFEAVCFRVANPWAAFHARFGASTTANAAAAASAAGQVQAARAARDRARCSASPMMK